MIAEQTERSGWHQVGKDEWMELLPFTLDAADLSGPTCNRIRREFRDAALTSLQLIVAALGRAPTQDEFDKLRAALAKHFNEVRIPEIAVEVGECAGRGES